ncbi:MAG: protein kinase, partial [Gemmatimonadaceae bacterium]|nr:protein kinase [Gemmatimonadaceae bacterium]
MIGTVIAERYRVVSRIGEGGMGQVFLAEHVRMKRKSAIKIMRPALVGDVDALQRFTREAENASQLSHPNIAAIFDFGETPDGVVYLAMEYVDGESLSAKLNQYSALHPDVAADILGQAADALQAAHDLSMLHRDVKPDNIMLGKRSDGTYMVKLVDFGIARTMDGSDQKVTRTGFAVGTPQYMSPEQLAGDVLDARSDQYSLALVAFVALTGKQAFPAESSKESLIARLTSRPQTLQNAKQDVQWPEALQEIFNRALSPEPAERFPSVSDFAHALSGAISNMTPSQTAELYRRALDVRVANVAARTPHSDMELLRTPSGSLLTLTPPSGAAMSGARAPVDGGSGIVPAPLAGQSGAMPPLVGSPTFTGDASGTYAPLSVAGAAVPPARPRARWPFVIAAVVTVSVLGTWMFTRRDASRGDSAAAAATTDSAVSTVVAATASPAVVAPSSDSAQRNASASKPVPPSTAPTLNDAKASGATVGANGTTRGGSPAADSGAARTSARDSARRENARRSKAAADSAARANSARARFPEAAARAMLSRGVDAKARMARNDDIRVVIMPTPVFVWRAEQARGYKDAHMKPNGETWAAVDPIEFWSPWTS